MKSLILSLFGTYVPTTYLNAEGIEIIPNGVSGLDIPYLLGVLLFAICLWQVLACLRGFVNRD